MTEIDMKKMDSIVKGVVNRMQVPQNLFDDAMQEGRLAYLTGDNVLTHLTKWYRKENSFRGKLGLTSDTSIEDPSNQDNRLNARVDEVKPKI